MKILESVPERYDRGIGILTLGKLSEAYDRLICHIEKGQKVLDIGCGTGALTLRAARRGGLVKGIDINSQMLDIAQKQAKAANLKQNIELCEMGIAELESEKSLSYDVVMSGLCFSELSDDELMYTLKQVKRLLKPDGSLLIADEVASRNILKKIANWLVRMPLKAITYLLTQTGTNAVADLPEKVKRAGYRIESLRLNRMENFIELVAKKDGENK